MNRINLKVRLISLGIFILLIFICLFKSGTPAEAAAKKKITSASDMFSVAGSAERFILLDSTDEGFYVLTQMYYGTRAFDADDTSRFDITDPNNMGYFLNNEFIKEGRDGKKLPEEILNHLVEREWDIEEGYPGLAGAEAFKTTAKIALLSRADCEKYGSIFGYADDTSNSWWYLRSPAANTVGNGAGVIAVCTTSGSVTNFKNTRGNSIRPAFYLDKDFFKEVKLNTNLKYLGDNIKIALRNNYTKADLAGIYSTEELKTIFDEPLKPSASVTGVRNYPGVGSELEVLYDFYSPSGKKDGGSIVRWLKSKTKDGIYTVAAKGKKYSPKPEDAGYYIKIDIIPIDEDKTMGLPSDTYLLPSKIWADYKPEASNVYLIGENSVGTRLVLNYNYSDKNMFEKERGTLITWERSKDGESFEEISGAKTKNYIITKEDVGYVLRASVTVNNDTSIGEKTYTPATAVVYEKPSAENVKVTLEGDYAEGTYSYIGNCEEKDTELWWEVSEKADGKYIRIAGSANERIILDGLEGRFIRFAVAARDIEGHIGKALYSDSAEINGDLNNVELKGAGDAVDLGNGARLFASGKISPKLITMEIVCENPEALSITSEMYNIFTTVRENGVKCTLMLKGGDIAFGNVEIAEISGEAVKINDVKAGIYRADGSAEIGNYIPRIERR